MILIVWHNHYGNNMDMLTRAFGQLGYDTCIFTNGILWGENAPVPGEGSGRFMQMMPSYELQEEWREARNGRNNNRFDCYCPYLAPWSWVYEQWPAYSKDRPEFILIMEGDWTPGGDLPSEWQGIPILYYAMDSPRGPDHHMRQAFRASATAILANCKWYMPYYQLKTHISEKVGEGIHHSGLSFEHVYWLPVSSRWLECLDKPLEEKPYELLFMGNPGLQWTKDGATVSPPIRPDNSIDVTGEYRLLCDGDVKYGEYRQRGTLFRKLLEEGPFDLHFLCSHFGEAYRAQLAKAKVVWNCQGGYECTHGGITNRPMEAASAGSIPCTNWTDEIEDLFEPDEEAIIYPVSFCSWHSLFAWFDYALMCEKIREVVSDDARRKRMSSACLERVRREHLPKHRAARILDIVNHPGEVQPKSFRQLYDMQDYKR